MLDAAASAAAMVAVTSTTSSQRGMGRSDQWSSRRSPGDKAKPQAALREASREGRRAHGGSGRGGRVESSGGSGAVGERQHLIEIGLGEGPIIPAWRRQQYRLY